MSSLLINLTNKFHVAMRLFSNSSQMTSKCGKNKCVVHEAIAECVTTGGPTQSVWVADCYFIVNVLDLQFASPIAIYR